jgi:hypothetical protein
MDTPEEFVTEEPYPGWLRTEKEGSRPYYKSPFPRTVIRSGAILRDYLVKHNRSRCADFNPPGYIEKKVFFRKLV